MPEESPALPLAEVRRRDRAVTDDGWIRGLLHRAPFGTLATVRDGQPFVVGERAVRLLPAPVELRQPLERRALDSNSPPAV